MQVFKKLCSIFLLVLITVFALQANAQDKALDYRKYIVNLPCSTNLSFEDCDRVIEAVLGL